MPQRAPDEELEQSTTRWMVAGITLTALFALMFPIYRVYEPAGRNQARANLQASLAVQGGDLYQTVCASCHGANGQGVDAPALNSQQFLEAADDRQIASLIAHGIPGSEMSAYSLDFGGILTQQQIDAVTTYLRSLEPDAPDRPDWRSATIGGDGVEHDEEPEPAEHDEEPEPAEHDEEPEPEPAEHDD